MTYEDSWSSPLQESKNSVENFIALDPAPPTDLTPSTLPNDDDITVPYATYGIADDIFPHGEPCACYGLIGFDGMCLDCGKYNYEI